MPRPQQVTLAWMLAKGSRVIPIPGSSRPSHGRRFGRGGRHRADGRAGGPPRRGLTHDRNRTGHFGVGRSMLPLKKLTMKDGVRHASCDRSDNLALPHIANTPSPVTRHPTGAGITDAPSGFEGEGFPVRRAFAGVAMADLDPFIHMDQMGEVEYAPGEPKGTPWHPHRGFETVTYMIDGTFQHQDSIGGGGLITNGSTQWMTAGSGILHIERPPEELIASGGLFHGMQLWVNLPAAQKMVDPRYQDLEAEDTVLLTSPDGGALVRVIAGDVAGHRGPGSTHTPISLVHATVQPGAELVLPWPSEFNALVYVLAGSGTVGPDAPRSTPDSWPCTDPATPSRCGPIRSQESGATRPSRSSSWAVGPSGSPWPPTGPSS
jgi:redox-sensitive bicupin YhaK (pirin superfamily)